MVRQGRNQAFQRTLLTLIILILPAQYNYIFTQPGDYYYRITFRDKGNNTVSSFKAEELMSERAVDRRRKAGIMFPDYHDMPVWKEYIDGITSLGLRLHSSSKWMNSALFRSENLVPSDMLLSLPFVIDARIVRTVSDKKIYHDKFGPFEEQAEMPPYNNPIVMLQGDVLHDSGLNGKGILIAVLDAGFFNTRLISSLNDLRNRQGIKATYDFITNSPEVYSYDSHGTAVLSILAGKSEGMIEGSATGADYLLLRTEDSDTESPSEEDHWIAAAEYADSAGADIINSSIGYFWFDDPVHNYKQSDLDGNMTYITKAADIAASRGILVVNSAGNERDNEWLSIIAPADGDSVLCVGAVDSDGAISYFSSAGPSSDKRIKPDVTAQGVSVPVQISPNDFIRASGTSFSCPVISGMCACMMQAVPEATNLDLITALHYSGNRFSRPDSLYGYGIPDMLTAVNYLKDKYIPIRKDGSAIGPNPFYDRLTVFFKESPLRLTAELHTISGLLILRREFKEHYGRSLLIDDLPDLKQGVYILRLTTDRGLFVHKVIKAER